MSGRKDACLFINGAYMGPVSTAELSHGTHVLDEHRSRPAGIGPALTVEARAVWPIGRVVSMCCWKCHDGRTRAHHRRCYKRGDRKDQP